MVTSDSCNSGHSENYEKILTFSCKSLKFSTKGYTKLCILVDPFLRNYVTKSNFRYLKKKAQKRLWHSGLMFFLFEVWSQEIYLNLLFGFYDLFAAFIFLPLTAMPLFKKSLFHRYKFQLWNVITGDWFKLFAKFGIPFCSKFYPLSKNWRAFFVILPVEGAIAPANAPYQRT